MKIISSTSFTSDSVKVTPLPAYGEVSIESRDITNIVDIHLSRAEAMQLVAAIQDAFPQEDKRHYGGYASLSPLAKTIFQHMQRAGSISAREAMNDYGVMTGSLVRRLTDMEEAGFEINRERRIHPITGKRYTRYSIAA